MSALGGAKPQVSSVDMNAKRVLVVDDDKVFRQMVCALLRAYEFDTVEAENGLEGLQMLSRYQPDLVLCDIEMPIMNGLEFVEEVSRAFPSLPTIVISNTEQMSVVAQALRYGIKDFLTKPINNPKHLLEAVEEALKGNDQTLASSDFSSEWFGLGKESELPGEAELHWHLKELKKDPALATQLLQALNPSTTSRQGNWQCRFRLIQQAGTPPLIYDYIWLMNGQWLMYAVDTYSAPEHGAATALLIRAMVNEHVRRHHGRIDSIYDLVKELNNTIAELSYAEAIHAYFGLADCPAGQFHGIQLGLPIFKQDPDDKNRRMLGAEKLEHVEHLGLQRPLSDDTPLVFVSEHGARLHVSFSHCHTSELV